jgi:hypothetical protein
MNDWATSLTPPIGNCNHNQIVRVLKESLKFWLILTMRYSEILLRIANFRCFLGSNLVKLCHRRGFNLL